MLPKIAVALQVKRLETSVPGRQSSPAGAPQPNQNQPR
jgi:hypothetical protein